MLFNYKKLASLQKYSDMFAKMIAALFFLFFSPVLFAVNSIDKYALPDILNNNVSLTGKNFTIIQKPIKFNEERLALTRQYRLEHYGIKNKSIEIQPRIIVLHWTCALNLQGVYNVFYSSTLPSDRADIQKGGKLNVSAHFLVDRDGTIYQLMPTNWMARHTIGLNDSAIGIENMGGIDDHEDLTLAQVNSNIYLVHYLKKQYPSIKYLIGHYEYGDFRATKLWLEKNNNYFTTKTDPGKKFMFLIRKSLNNGP